MAERKDPDVISIEGFRRKVSGRVEEQDSKFLDPTERAEAVIEWLFIALGGEPGEDWKIAGPTYWDLLCFAVNFIGQAAVASQDEGFIEAAKLCSNWVHQCHYSFHDTAESLGGSRRARLEFWAQRMKEAKHD